MAGSRRVGAESENTSVVLREADLSRVRAVLALGGVPWDEVDDGAQQVRLKYLEALAKPGHSSIENEGAWLSVVASRVAVDWHRERAREMGLRERLAVRWSEHSPPDHSEDDRLLALTVAEGLETLSPVQRQVLLLRFYEDLTVPCIAELLDLPVGTVKSRLHAAVNAMRTRLRGLEVS